MTVVLLRVRDDDDDDDDDFGGLFVCMYIYRARARIFFLLLFSNGALSVFCISTTKVQQVVY